MSYPLGTKWQAGANGDCSQAGTCPDGGACGDGTITDCPDYWESTQTLSIEYTPGGSMKIGGRTISPGERVQFLRGDNIPAQQYSYGVEFFRGAGGIESPANPDDIPVGIGATAFTLAGLPLPWSAFNGVYTKTAAGHYTKGSQNIFLSGGQWQARVGTDVYGIISMSATAATVEVESGKVIWRDAPISNVFRWTPGSTKSLTLLPGNYNAAGLPEPAGTGPWPYQRASADGSNPAYWTDGTSLWGNGTGSPTGTTQGLVYYDGGGGTVAGKYASFADKAPASVAQFNDFWVGGDSFSGTVSYAGGYTPSDSLADGTLEWEVRQTPLFDILIPATDYNDLPEDPLYDAANLVWGARGFVDFITLTALPSYPVSGTISLTIRSACVEPPP